MFRKSIVLLLLLTRLSLSALAVDKDSITSLIVEKGRAQFKQLQEQNRVNDSLGLSSQNQYIVNVQTDDLFPDPEVESMDAEFIKQRRLTWDKNDPNKIGSYFIYYKADLDLLNEQLQQLNTKPGNDIKTYVLLVDFVPMVFDGTLKLGTNFKDLVNRDSVGVENAAVAQMAFAEASSIVKSITDPFISAQKDTKMLYCGFLRFRAFINQLRLRDFYIYYPQNSVEDGETSSSYNVLLDNYIARIKFKTGGQYVNDFIDAVANNNDDFKNLPSVRAEIMKTKDPVKMEELLNIVSSNSYELLNIDERVHALKVLSALDIPDSREITIDELIESTPADQIAQLFEEMQKRNDADPVLSTKNDYYISKIKKDYCLLQCILANTEDEVLWWGENNYKRLLQALIKLTKDRPDFNQMVQDYRNDPNVAQRKIVWDRSYALAIFTKVPVGTNTYTVDVSETNGEVTFQKKQRVGYIHHPGGAWEDNGTGGASKSEAYDEPDDETEPELKLKPFELISFTNKSDLSLLSDAVGDAGSAVKKEQFVPAILLGYAADKKMNQDVGKGIEMGMDVITLVIPAGELIYLGKIANYVYKGIEIASKIGSVANLAVNTEVVPPDSKLAKLIKKYQAITAVLQLVNVGATVRNIQLGKISRLQATEFLESYYRAEADMAKLTGNDAAAIDEMRKLKTEIEQAGEVGGYGKGWFNEIRARVSSAFDQSLERFKNFSFFKQQKLENGAIRFMDGTTTPVAHTAADGTLIVDKTGSLVEADAHVLDIIEDAKFKTAEGSSAVATEDLMLVQKADGTITCVRGACFVAGTPVHTPQGIRPIETIRESEKVISTDLNTGDTVWQQVERSFHKTASRLVRVIAGADTILSTPEHPYLTISGWKSAADLQPGQLLKIANHDSIVVNAVTIIDTTATVFNFTVANTHNYSIGRQGIIVHNDCSILAKLRNKIKPELYDDFVKDFNKNTALLQRFEKGELSIEAWELIHVYKDYRSVASNLELATKLLKNGKLSSSGLSSALLKRLMDGNYGASAAALDQLLKGMDDLISSGTVFTNFEKLLIDMEKGDNFAVGARWIGRYMVQHPDDFKGLPIYFESVEKVGENIRRVDIKVKGEYYTFYEFKSTKTIPPDGFAKQFSRDMQLQPVKKLEQLKWRFDPDKAATLSKADFVTEIKNNKELFEDEKILNIFRAYSKKTILDADGLIKYLSESEDWFNTIFKATK